MQSLKLNLDKIYNDAASWVVVTLLGVVAWLVRTILTNGKEIELLKADILSRKKDRDEDREENRERMRKMETAIERVEGILLNVAHRQK